MPGGMLDPFGLLAGPGMMMGGGAHMGGVFGQAQSMNDPFSMIFGPPQPISANDPSGMTHV